jgi:hypothetical protein
MDGRSLFCSHRFSEPQGQTADEEEELAAGSTVYDTSQPIKAYQDRRNAKAKDIILKPYCITAGSK